MIVSTEHLCVEHVYVLELVLLKTSGNNTPGSLFSSQNPLGNAVLLLMNLRS